MRLIVPNVKPANAGTEPQPAPDGTCPYDVWMDSVGWFEILRKSDQELGDAETRMYMINHSSHPERDLPASAVEIYHNERGGRITDYYRALIRKRAKAYSGLFIAYEETNPLKVMSLTTREDWRYNNMAFRITPTIHELLQELSADNAMAQADILRWTMLEWLDSYTLQLQNGYRSVTEDSANIQYSVAQMREAQLKLTSLATVVSNQSNGNSANAPVVVRQELDLLECVVLLAGSMIHNNIAVPDLYTSLTDRCVNREWNLNPDYVPYAGLSPIATVAALTGGTYSIPTAASITYKVTDSMRLAYMQCHLDNGIQKVTLSSIQ